METLHISHILSLVAQLKVPLLLHHQLYLLLVYTLTLVFHMTPSVRHTQITNACLASHATPTIPRPIYVNKHAELSPTVNLDKKNKTNDSLY
jgi:hypothetical protein